MRGTTLSPVLLAPQPTTSHHPLEYQEVLADLPVLCLGAGRPGSSSGEGYASPRQLGRSSSVGMGSGESQSSGRGPTWSQMPRSHGQRVTARIPSWLHLPSLGQAPLLPRLSKYGVCSHTCLWWQLLHLTFCCGIWTAVLAKCWSTSHSLHSDLHMLTFCPNVCHMQTVWRLVSMFVHHAMQLWLTHLRQSGVPNWCHRVTEWYCVLTCACT